MCGGKCLDAGVVLGLDEVGTKDRDARSDREDAAGQELRNRLRIHASRRHQRDVRHRALQVLDVMVAEIVRREELHDVRPERPRPLDLRRRHRPGDRRHAEPLGLGDHGGLDAAGKRKQRAEHGVFEVVVAGDVDLVLIHQYELGIAVFKDDIVTAQEHAGRYLFFAGEVPDSGGRELGKVADDGIGPVQYGGILRSLIL